MTNEELRNRIDIIDGKIAELIKERMEISLEIGKNEKTGSGKIYVPERERRVLENVSEIGGPAAERIYRAVLAESRRAQETLLREGAGNFFLLGKRLGHSISPELHKRLGAYNYSLKELEEPELYDFIMSGDYDGFNVTVPYKKAVCRMCDVLSQEAKAVGAVNTCVKRDGKLWGFNTDITGFETLLKICGVDVKNKRTAILGTGGCAAAVKYVLENKGAAEILSVSRSGEINYSNVYEKLSETEILINCTPVGMYPNTGSVPLEVGSLKKLTTVIDAIYNPSKTRLLMDAKLCGLKAYNGLPMLAAQAAAASEIFKGSDEPANPGLVYDIISEFSLAGNNIVLIGMPGSGKSTVGRRIAEETGRVFMDCDSLFESENGIKPSEFLLLFGENTFRKKESAIVTSLRSVRNAVIATGGGVVCNSSNYYSLAENGLVMLLDTPVERLAREGRPLTAEKGAENILLERQEKYKLWSDVIIKL